MPRYFSAGVKLTAHSSIYLALVHTIGTAVAIHYMPVGLSLSPVDALWSRSKILGILDAVRLNTVGMAIHTIGVTVHTFRVGVIVKHLHLLEVLTDTVYLNRYLVHGVAGVRSIDERLDTLALDRKSVV